MSNVNATGEMVTVYGLASFDVDPSVHGGDSAVLVRNCDAIVYSLRPEWLPHGGWKSQGALYEVMVTLSVPADSHIARGALQNSQVEGRTP